MPMGARIPGCKKYYFTSYYTVRYLKQAIGFLTPELAARTDLAPDLRKQLAFMIGWLSTHQLEFDRITQIEG